MKPFIHASLWVIILLFSLHKSGNAQPLTALGPTTFCQGNSVVLSVPLDSATSYVWLHDSTLISGQQGNQLTVTNTGNYRVIRSSAANCCDTSNSIFVQVNALPIATINPSGTVTVYCGPSVPTLTTTPTVGATYQWFKDNVAIAGATSTSYLPFSIGVYHVVVTSASGCQQSSPTLTIVGGAPPTTQFNISAVSVPCAGQATIQVTAVPGVINYRWYQNNILIATTQSTSLLVTVAGDYYVQAVWHPLCPPLTTSPIYVSLTTPPTPFITALGSTQFCSTDSVTLTIGSGYFVSWFRDGVMFTSGIGMTSITVNTPGTYHCTVRTWSPQGSGITPCTGSSTNSIMVTHLPSPAVPVLSIRADTIFSSIGTGNSWFLNGVQLAGMSDSFLVITQPGNYNAVHVLGSCQSDTSNTLQIGNVQVVPLNGNIFKVYPNPASGRFFIDLPISADAFASIHIYNMYGALISEKELLVNVNSNRIEMEIVGQPSGLYTIEIRQGQKLIHQRMVLQRH